MPDGFSTSRPMSLIHVKNLKKSYENDGVSTKVLFGITFAIEKGEFVAIMGPSGSGKSTLLHILGFLDRPSEGKYLFEAKDSDEYSDEEASHIRNKKMGFVFQTFNLLPKTDVYDNVKLPLIYSDVKESEWHTLVKQAVESVGLTHRMDHEPSQLSGGERQRVAIARALVNQPEVIFADEPTGNLDSKSGQHVMEILENLNKRKKHTIILITHETSTAEHAHRIIRLKDGLILSDTKVKNHRYAEHFSK